MITKGIETFFHGPHAKVTNVLKAYGSKAKARIQLTLQATNVYKGVSHSCSQHDLIFYLSKGEHGLHFTQFVAPHEFLLTPPFSLLIDKCAYNGQNGSRPMSIVHKSIDCCVVTLHDSRTTNGEMKRVSNHKSLRQK